MKINSKVINIPPFISTSWENIASLHMKGSTLAVVLTNGETIQVPGLAPSTVALIFAAHGAYLEEAEIGTQKPNNLLMEALGVGNENVLKFGFSTLDGLGVPMQHDPTHKDAPPMPDEILSKITAIAKIVTNEEEVNFPKAEPGCNCIHCQICRALSGDLVQPIEESTVSEEELRFKDWEIVQKGDKLYEVTNPLEKEEKYTVFLGDPVGCTCGNSGCEHILAVLKS